MIRLNRSFGISSSKVNTSKIFQKAKVRAAIFKSGLPLTQKKTQTIDNYKFTSEHAQKEAERAINYAIASFVIKKDNTAKGNKMEKPEDILGRFSRDNMDENDAKNILKCMDNRISHSIYELQQTFAMASIKDVEKLEDLLRRNRVVLYQDKNTNELVFAARGSNDKRDVLHDIDTLFNKKGGRTDDFIELLKFMDEKIPLEKRPTKFVGSSLGGAMASMAYRAIGDKNTSKAIVFDAMALNRTQQKYFDNEFPLEDNVKLDETNYRLRSPLTLGSLQKTPIFGRYTTTVRLNNEVNHDSRSPINRLMKNHSPSSILNAIKNTDIKSY